MSEEVRDGAGRGWTLRGSTMRDMSIFTDQVTKLKALGVDLAPELFGSLGGLLSNGGAGSVMALTGIAPQFLSVERLACLIRTCCVLIPEFDRVLEQKIEAWPVADAQKTIEALLPFFLGKWSEVYLGSLITIAKLPSLTEALTQGLKGGKPSSTSTNESQPNSLDLEEAAIPKS